MDFLIVLGADSRHNSSGNNEWSLSFHGSPWMARLRGAAELGHAEDEPQTAPAAATASPAGSAGLPATPSVP